MRIDPLPAGGNPDLHLSEGKAQVRQPEKVAVPREAAAPVAEKPAAAPSALPVPERVSVSIDESRELVYRFVDAKTGEVISQTPPEEVLRVVRGIQDLLRAEQPRKDPGVNVRG
jgi:FlaG protein